MINELQQETKLKMEKSLENLKHEFLGIRSNNAEPALLEHVEVKAYDQKMPLNNLATVSAKDTRTLHVSVWDEANVQAVDAGIRNANLGLNPQVESNNLYISLPTLSTERREELVKVLKQKAENSKISIRNIRRDSNDKAKKIEADKSISEDELNDHLKHIQELTDSYIHKVEQMSINKQKEIIAI